jgi:hypothetical protein
MNLYEYNTSKSPQYTVISSEQNSKSLVKNNNLHNTFLMK